MDYSFLLIDTETGETMSEYRMASTPAGPFFRDVLGRFWLHYACSAPSLAREVTDNFSTLELLAFLDKALLPPVQ